jgi:hypothetical protein
MFIIVDMNIKKYEAPLHGRAKKKFNPTDSDDDEEEDEKHKKDRKRSVSTASGRRARTVEIDEDDEHTIDGKDFLKMLQKKKTVRSTSSRSKDGSGGSADSENVPEEKKAGRRFLREKPTRKKGSVEYFSAELNDDEKESVKRAQMKGTLSEEMLAKKALKDAKFKRLLSRKSADDDKRYRD